MSQSLNETKAVKSHFNFYPAHYFAEAIQSDVKDFNSSEGEIKKAKKTAEAKLIELSECKNGSKEAAELRKEIIDLTYKSFGFYNISQGTPDLLKTEIPIRIQNKEYCLNASKRITLRGHSELWMFDANLDQVLLESEFSTELSNAIESEHSFDLPGLVNFKSQSSWFYWKDILEALFDCDSPHADWIIMNTGAKIFLFEKAKWQEEQSYLELNIQELFEVNHDDTYKLAQALFSPNAFPINTADFFHEKIAHNAHKKASEVTKSLRDTVRESIELIANEIMSSHHQSPLPSFKKYNLNDDEQRELAAQSLFEQSLKYVYRMLFMLFTESQENSKGSLPVNSKVYQRGYAIEKLRDLVDIPMQDSASGQFIQKTLEKSFDIYFKGYHSDLNISDSQKDSLGFSFPSLGTTLFNPETTPLLKEAKLKDGIMQQVLRKMSLAKTGSGKKARTQRVHYAGLGLNQLGAVYEGLLSLKPEILSERVILLVKEQKDLAHRYIAYSKKSEVPQDKLYKDEDTESYMTKEKDEFLLTPVGLERKFSASFYTPEILTRFVAKEAVDTLLESDSSLKRLESIKILEPAMGSGAFLNAVVDELAPKIAKFKEADAKAVRQTYLDKNPNKYEEAPKVESFDYYKVQAKSYLMKNSVYGVDLNGTAVELAKVSLWLNCLHHDGNLPFMDFKLRLGNSLVGSWVKRHFEYDNVPHWFFPNPAALDSHLDGKILGNKKTPFITDEKLTAKLKALKAEFNDAHKDAAIKAEFKQLASQVEKLYETHLNNRKQFQENLLNEQKSQKKQEIFDTYVENNFAYNQLRFAMDMWCALWFWPHSEIKTYPNFKKFSQALKWCLTTSLKTNSIDLIKQIDQSGLDFLKTARQITLDQKFFHYDLEFAEVFSEGGFDLVLGNPPWAPVRWEEADFFEAASPGIHDVKGSSKDYHSKYEKIILTKSSYLEKYKHQKTRVDGLVNFLKLSRTYPFEDRSQANTYKYFYQRFYSSTKPHGLHGMIAQDGIFTDDGCLEMRSNFISEAKKVFRFRNELNLFEDVDHNVKFCIWFGKKENKKLEIQLIDNLYHPSTVEKCRSESPNTPYRGIKDENNKWELRGHPKRIVNLDENILKFLGKFENQNDPLKVGLPTIHGNIELEILINLASHQTRFSDIDWKYCPGFHEAQSPKKGYITRKPGKAKSIEYSVLTGPNIFYSNPANKQPRANCKNNLDFEDVNLEEIKDNFYPDTVYQSTEKGLKSAEYNSITDWGNNHSQQYRIVARRMVGTVGTRTLSAAIIPPGPSHVQTLNTLGFKNISVMINTMGLFNSLLFDFLMRSISGGEIVKGVYEMTPVLNKEQLNSPLIPALKVRALRLSCISSYYDELWKSNFETEYKSLKFKSKFEAKLNYSNLSSKWERETSLRNVEQREQALCEIDAIVAILFNLSKETLLNLYRSQFGVLQSNLQDLPNQKIKEDEYHFPRFQAMGEAYDQAIAYVEQLSNKSKKSA